MADTKASILLGASFVVFSLSIGSIAEGKASFPLLVLTTVLVHRDRVRGA